MRRLTLILIAALFLIVVFLSQGTLGKKKQTNKCEGKKDPFRHKILKVAIYYTDELKKFWNKQKYKYYLRRPATIREAITNLIRETNAWFTPEKLGNGNSVKIVIKNKDIRKISAKDAKKVLEAVGPHGLHDAAEPFCEYAYRKKRKRDDWNLVFFFSTMDKNNYETYFTNSAVRAIKGICQTEKKLNCGIALHSSYKAETFNIYPAVWSRVIGLELGLKYFCTNINPNDTQKITTCLDNHGGTDSMMIAPVKAKYWYIDSKNLLNSYFKNPNDYPCLKWECQV